MAVDARVTYVFRIYVAGHTLNSTRAVASLTAMCNVHLPDRYEIEIVDVFTHPERALADGIMMTPTLLKLSPLPQVRLVGSLGPIDSLLQALEIDPLNTVS